MLHAYEGYSAKVTVDEGLGVFHGEVLGTSDVITFQGSTVEELAKAFHDSVDDYLAFCEERGEKPDKPFSGRFVLRLTPKLHRDVATVAELAGASMNEWITEALKVALKPTAAAKLEAEFPLCCAYFEAFGGSCPYRLVEAKRRASDYDAIDAPERSGAVTQRLPSRLYGSTGFGELVERLGENLEERFVRKGWFSQPPAKRVTKRTKKK